MDTKTAISLDITKENFKKYLSLFTKEELYNLIIKDNNELKLKKYEEYTEKIKKTDLIKLDNNLLYWSECYLDKNKDISNEIYINQMKKILSKLGIDIKYCDLRIFAEEETFDKVKLLIENECHNTKCQIIKIIKIYLNNFAEIAGIEIPNKIYYAYEYYYDKLNKKKNITKDTSDIIKFEDLLVKMYEILNDTIDITIQQKQYINLIKIICLIYSYGYDIKEEKKIGILRYCELINTIVIKDDYKTELNYISYIDKKWYIRAKYTKNKEDREINLTDDFLLKLDKYRNKSKNNYLLMYNYKDTSSIVKIIKLFNLPQLKDMRKSAEQYSYDNFKLQEGKEYTKNNGHKVKTVMVSYINQNK
jgi:hypothetical protein